jgi:hypothetical protein
VRIVRTTLNIDDRLLAAAKRRAREQGLSLGQVVDAALRRDLAQPEVDDAPPVPVFAGRGGLQPGVDAASNQAMLERLEDGQPLDQLR